MWAEVSSSTPHLLRKGLLVSPIKWRCLLRVLCPVRRPITTLDCVLFKNPKLVFALGLGSEINSRVCLWVLTWHCHVAKCWLSNQHFIFLLLFRLDPPKDGWGQKNFWTEQFLASFSAISFHPTQHVPGPSTALHYAGRDIIQCLLALLYQWRGSGSLKVFQNCMAVSANTLVLLWSTIQWNFISTIQDSTYEPEKTLHTFLEKYWAFFPHIAHRLQPQSRPSWTHL